VHRLEVERDEVPLVTLRLYLRDGSERLLSSEIEDVRGSPAEILESVSENGRIALGDRESLSLDQVLKAEREPPPEPQTGPSWGPGLQDEDVAAALEENFEPPA
jgi:hypothetical protein